MFNFPTPYPDELIYSTVARAGVRLALTSPKQLLDEVFQNRKVSATVDLPCHLEKILQRMLYHRNYMRYCPSRSGRRRNPQCRRRSAVSRSISQ